MLVVKGWSKGRLWCTTASSCTADLWRRIWHLRKSYATYHEARGWYKWLSQLVCDLPGDTVRADTAALPTGADGPEAAATPRREPKAPHTSSSLVSVGARATSAHGMSAPPRLQDIRGSPNPSAPGALGDAARMRRGRPEHASRVWAAPAAGSESTLRGGKRSSSIPLAPPPLSPHAAALRGAARRDEGGQRDPPAAGSESKLKGEAGAGSPRRSREVQGSPSEA